MAGLKGFTDAINTSVSEGMDIFEELARREVRLKLLAAAKEKIEVCARERFGREEAKY